MQQLGLSKSTPKSESRLKALLWPDVSSLPGAKTAIDLGRVTGFIIAGGTVVIVLLGFMPPASLVDSVLFAALAFGIGRGSRVCAALALVLYLLGQLSLYAAGRGGFNVVMPIIITFLFANALRASIVLRRLRKGSDRKPGAEAPGAAVSATGSESEEPPA